MMNDIRRWLETLAVTDCPDEYETKQLLQRYGIRIPESIRLHPDAPTPDPDFKPPYVVKVCAGSVLHKTDQGGVLLNLDRDALGKGIEHIRNRFPGKAVLIEEQIGFRETEFIVGALVDPDFGPAVMVGAGGVLTELYKDVAFRLAPCPAEEALRMLGELTLSPVLEGFRGIDLDRNGLARIISSTGEIAMALGDRFSQLDINPLVCSGGKWVALDAKLLLCKSG